MKLLRACLVLCVIVSLIALAVPAVAADDAAMGRFAPDRIIIKFKDGTGANDKQQIHARHYGCQIIDEIEQLNAQVVKVPIGRVNEEVQAYEQEDVVEHAEPDYVVKTTETPNDPGFSNQWGLPKIHAPEAWNITTGDPGVTIAILDTGVDQNHEDLAKIVANVNFTSSRTVDDKYGHGTHVAGIAAAATNNGIGVAGAGYNCSIMNVKVLGDNGSSYTSWVINGIVWAADNGAKVINMSLGSSYGSSTELNAVNYAWNRGVVLVAAAGNDGSTAATYPAYFSNCIAVASTNQSDNKSGFSNYGTWVDVAAPGSSIYSTLPNSNHRLRSFAGLNYGYLSGTSMATPHVAGVAGLIWATGYGTDNTSVRNRIESTADTNTGIYLNYGIPRINAYSAVLSPVLSAVAP